MDSQTKLLIHIGYPKTASTWLQNKVFNPESGVFGQPCNFTYGQAQECFAYGRTFHFEPDAVFRIFQPGIHECEKRGLIPVISNENLVGTPTKPWDCGKQIADKIHQVFPHAHILIMLREQKDMILALHRQNIKQGRTVSLETFIKLSNSKPGFLPICLLERLEYDYLIDYYMKLFGSDKVLILPYETFKRDNQSSLQTILSFVNANSVTDFMNQSVTVNKLNVGYRGLTLEFRRRLNWVFPPRDFGPGGLSLGYKSAEKLTQLFDLIIPDSLNKKAHQKTKQFINQFIGDFYKRSNLKTQAITGLNLAELGYDC